MAGLGLLDLQRGSVQVGRLRIGQKVILRNNKPGPSRLDTFRFTTPSAINARAIAELYGGEMRRWAERPSEWEVITNESTLGVMVPAVDAMLTQSYEMWSGGVLKRRCNSVNAMIDGDPAPCACPHTEDAEGNRVPDPIARALLAKDGRACKPTTRLNVRLPDLPTSGVWRLDTHSYYAAREMGDVAELLEAVRDRAGVMLPATLTISQRERKILVPDPDKPGSKKVQVTKYPVPVLDILVTVRELMTGQLTAASAAAMLPPSPRLALTSAPSAGAPVGRTIEGAVTDAPTWTSVPAPPEPVQARTTYYSDNTAIVEAAKAARWREDIEALVEYARERLWLEDQVRTDDLGPGAAAHEEDWEELGSYLKHRWKELRHRPAATRPLTEPDDTPEPPPED